MYVPFFRCESFPYISRRAHWFPCALFPFHSPCTPLVFISVPFMSLSVPLCFPFISRCFPVMSTSYFLPSFPCTSLHFPLQKTRFFQRFRKEDVQKHRVVSRFSAKGDRKPKPAKEPAGGIEPGTPVLRPAPRRLRLVERHQSTARYVWDPPPGPYISSFRCPTRRAMSADFFPLSRRLLSPQDTQDAQTRTEHALRRAGGPGHVWLACKSEANLFPAGPFFDGGPLFDSR